MAATETFLKTKQVADALGVSVSTVKRWVDAGVMDATRTQGKHRLVRLSSALQFARRERFPLDHLLELADTQTSLVTDDRSIEVLVGALQQGRSREAYALIASVARAGGAVALADRVIRPVMERVGHGWLVGSVDVYEEHQATQIVGSALSELIVQAAQGPTPATRRPLALTATPEGDPYTLPGLLGELVLREGGWDVRNLGPNLPLRSLAAAIRHYRPGLVFLSVGAIGDRSRFLNDYPYFYEAATQVGSATILGGRALDPDLRSKLVYASFGDRMAHLAEFARMLYPAATAARASMASDSSDPAPIIEPNRRGKSDAHDATE